LFVVFQKAADGLQGLNKQQQLQQLDQPQIKLKSVQNIYCLQKLAQTFVGAACLTFLLTRERQAERERGALTFFSNAE